MRGLFGITKSNPECPLYVVAMAASGEGLSAGSPSTSPSRLPPIYDTYLCKERLSIWTNPPETVSLDSYEARLRILQASSGYFLELDRMRAVERLQFATGKVFMQQKQWGNALRVMRPLWESLSWRRAGWWQLVEEVDWALRECARMACDPETLIAVEWELLSKSTLPY